MICRRAEQPPPTKLPDQTRSTNIATVKSPTTSAPSITNTTSPADDETDTPAQPAITKNERLTILSLNILSLKPKILDLRHDLELLDCDIAVITETWLRPETSSRFITIPGFSLHRADRPDGSGHGGIVVLVKNNLKVKPIKSVAGVENDGKIETLWLQITNHIGRRFNLGSVYRPPRHTRDAISADLDCLDSQVQRVLLSSTENIVITGDLNCNLLAADNDVCKLKFNQFLQSLGLHQFVTDPTYVSGSLLDVFVSNAENFLNDVSVYPCPYSDHSMIKANLYIPKSFIYLFIYTYNDILNKYRGYSCRGDNVDD